MAAAGTRTTQDALTQSLNPSVRALACVVGALVIIGGAWAQVEEPPIAVPTASQPAAVASQIAAPLVDLNPRPLGQPGAAAKKTVVEKTQAPQPGAAAALMDNPVVRTSLSLGVVVGLILLCAAAFRKLGKRAGGGLWAAAGGAGASPAGILEILGRYPIARGQSLILLKVDRRILLLSQTTPRIRAGAGTLTTLAEITDPEEVASILIKSQDSEGATNSAKFQALLGRFDAGHRTEAEHTPLTLRDVRADAPADRMESWDDRAAPQAYPLVPPLADPRPAVAQQPMASSDSFGSLRQRLSALNGEAHR